MRIGTGILLIAVGAILAFAVSPPRSVLRYLDVFDLGLILVWTGVLVLAATYYVDRVKRSLPSPPQRRHVPPTTYRPPSSPPPARSPAPRSPAPQTRWDEAATQQLRPYRDDEGADTQPIERQERDY